MSWKIDAVRLYRAGGPETQDIDFRRAGLNVITGPAQTGKSALYDVIDYCLMKSTCSIPKGVIRNSVAHVGLRISKLSGKSAAIVRPLPRVPGYSKNDISFETGGPGFGLPDSVPEFSANIERGKKLLSEFTGIEPVPLLSDFEHPSEAEGWSVNIRHCSPYLYQPQDVIASRNVLFPGIQNFYKRRHVKDAAPYFFGAYDLEDVLLEKQIRQLETEKKQLQRELEEYESLGSRGWARGRELLRKAELLGLTDPQDPEDLGDLLQALEESVAVDGELSLGLPEAVDQKRREMRSVRSDLREVRAERTEIERLLGALDEGEEHGQSRLAKLEARELIGEDGHDLACPVCGVGNFPLREVQAQVSEAAEEISESSRVPAGYEPHLREELQEAEERERELDQEYRRIRSDLNDVIDWGDPSEEAGAERLILSGRIREYLRGMDEPGESPGQELTEIEREIERLKQRKASADFSAIHADLSSVITEVSQDLETEFPGAQVRFDLENLSLELREESLGQDWVRLEDIGSGANWLSYHVALILGAHTFFRQRETPVPGFVFLDQVSQAWFPPEVAEDPENTVPEGEDYDHVLNVYRVLRDVAERTGTQIIAVDHARIQEDWFNRAIQEDWWEGGALIPERW